jgi:vacuolar-type H+-ATPase subunit H
MSNLFVKTGDEGKNTYNFDLVIVPVAQAHRVVNVAQGQPGAQQVQAPPGPNAPPGAQPSENGAQPSTAETGREPAIDAREIERRKAEMLAEARKEADDLLRKARQDADEILRKSRQQAGRIVEEADQRAGQRINDVDRQMSQRASQEANRRFVQSLVLGLREVRINNPRVSVKKVNVTLDPRVLLFDERSYLRYVIQNTSETEFAYGSISLEAGPANSPVPIDVVQTKNENKLAPGESLTGIVIFDAKLVGTKERLTLYVRGEDKAEIARVSIQ